MGKPDTPCCAPVPHARVTVEDAFWKPRMDANREVTLPAEYEQLKKTGRLDAPKLKWKPGRPNKPHCFYDSDIAKWIEAAAYSLATHPDPALLRRVRAVVSDYAKAQMPDGYLNTYFQAVEPENRWTNLRDMHELYCAGHLMEAAVALADATGDTALLDVMARVSRHIAATFGRGKGLKRGYPGHEEIELALVRMYHATGDRTHLDLARYFIDERGRSPHYFLKEARARGEQLATSDPGRFAYAQAHKPVREQEVVEGHAVRAMYLYAGMADVALETGDAGLLAACRSLWKNLTGARMYVTGGIGPSMQNEGFTVDYDLNNDTAYAETCAAIGLVFWARRMLRLDPDRAYADVMERALYNGVLSGVSLGGDRFLYANPLAVVPGETDRFFGMPVNERQPWFGCACCPPNIARLLASLGGYVYGEDATTAWVHLYVQGLASLDVGGTGVTLSQKSGYPWDGDIRIEVSPAKPAAFTLALRLPEWCLLPEVWVNGKLDAVGQRVAKGYCHVRREWHPGDVVELRLPMDPFRVRAHPMVRAGLGRVTLQRGPLVYCLEQADNGPRLDRYALPTDTALSLVKARGLPKGVVAIRALAEAVPLPKGTAPLYSREHQIAEPATLTAIPYCQWGNRAPGEMQVWIRDML
jgi:uncharacterized protein